MSESTNRRVTYRQLEHLWEFLNKNREILTGYNKTARAREFSRRAWEEVAIGLNAHGDGAVKDCKAWNKIFRSQDVFLLLRESPFVHCWGTNLRLRVAC